MNQNEVKQGSQGRSKRLTFLGFLILGLQIGMLFAYGFAGKFSFITNFSATYQTVMLPIFFYMALFAVGLGLMLSFYARGTALGLATAIFTIALNIQLSPLLQKFWFNVFIGDFNRNTFAVDTDADIQFQDSNSVYMSVIYQRNAMAMTISYLLSCLATIGRKGLFQIFMSLLAFNVMWPLPYYCNIKLYYRDLPVPQNAFDDFGLTYIYVFAGFFGLLYSVFLNKGFRGLHPLAIPSKTSTMLSILGTTIVFCTLPATVLLHPVPLTTVPSDRINIGVLNIFFSQIASVITCITFSLLFGKSRRLSVHSIIISVLSGPAIVAQFGALDYNIAVYLTVGAFGGILAAFWTQILHRRFNQGKFEDAMSLIGGVTLPSFFGGIVVTPILYRIYYNTGRTTLTGVFNSDDYLRYNYVYYFITVGSALVAALIAGLFALCTKKNVDDFSIRKLFSPDYGLCNAPVSQIQIDNKHQQDSAQNFKK